MGDAGEGLNLIGIAGQIVQGLMQAAGNVVEGDFVVKTDVFAQIDMVQVKGQMVSGCGGLQGLGQLTVGVGIGDAPAVDKDQTHDRYSHEYCMMIRS